MDGPRTMAISTKYLTTSFARFYPLIPTPMHPPRKSDKPLDYQNDYPAFSVQCPLASMDRPQPHPNTEGFPSDAAQTHHTRGNVFDPSVGGMYINNYSMDQNRLQQFGIQPRSCMSPNYGALPLNSESCIENSAQHSALGFADFAWNECFPRFFNPTSTFSDSGFSHQAFRRPCPTSSGLIAPDMIFPADHAYYDTIIRSAGATSSDIRPGDYYGALSSDQPRLSHPPHHPHPCSSCVPHLQAGLSVPKAVPQLAIQRCEAYHPVNVTSICRQHEFSRSVLVTNSRVMSTDDQTLSVGGLLKPANIPGWNSPNATGATCTLHPAPAPQNTPVNPDSKNSLPAVHSCGWTDGSVPCNVALNNDLRDLRPHFRKYHRLNTTGKYQTTCQWLGCSQTLQRENLLRHIVTCHLQIKVRCPDCDRKLARNDVWIKHALRCPKRRVVAPSTPEAKDV
ncbi:hypothetical protein BS17DRAFT_788992 [Gyrodon lividus]|nr:hypothetical protein BS17DRAFT_788992 [Gyrodon lividus]